MSVVCVASDSRPLVRRGRSAGPLAQLFRGQNR